MDFTRAEADVLARILQWRRDVRHFLPTPIAEDVLERLRQAMERAPSVGNARPWRVIRVDDPDVRRAVRATFADANADAAAHMAEPLREPYRQLKLAGLDAAPVQLAVFTVLDPAAGHGLGRRTMPATLQQSTAMAIHTLWLAARAENIGLGMVSILETDVMVRLLAVPAEWEFSAYLCLGYPQTADDTPLLHRVDWQPNTETKWEHR